MTTAFANPFVRSFNPFVSSNEDTLVDVPVEAATAKDVSYALVQSGPAVASEEVESHLDAVEVKVRWGTQTLAMKHIEQGAKKNTFTIGEGADFVVPHFEGTLDVVKGSTVSIPVGASATLSKKGEHPVSMKGGDEVSLSDGMTVSISLGTSLGTLAGFPNPPAVGVGEVGEVTIEVSSVRAGKKFKVGFLTALASGAAASIALSFVGHAAIVASMAMFMPKMNNDDAEAISREQILKMQAIMTASQEPENEKVLQELESNANSTTGGSSKGGEPHAGESGAAGIPSATTKGHMAFKGSDDHAQMSREQILKEAREGGFIGILNSGAPKTGHTSKWTDDPNQLGQDPDNKFGAMFGDDPNDAMGYGLGLWGTGEGGGGHGKGIGLDGFGDLLGGGGNGPNKFGIGKGDKDGIGNGHGPTAGGHIPKAPQLRQPTNIETNGRIPAEVIQRIVRQNFGRFRLCYESGLRNNPALTGRVVTKFVIDRNGAVSQASDAGSDMPNKEVTACIVRSFGNLSFPQPEGGIATVTYPIALSPGE